MRCLKIWEQMEYNAFLETRREMMAQIIREESQTLKGIGILRSKAAHDEFDLTTVMSTGENDAAEFKSTLRTNLHTGAADKRMELAALKTLAGFPQYRWWNINHRVSDDDVSRGHKTRMDS